MKSMLIRRHRALSSVLATLGTLQLRALGLLICIDFMDSLPNRDFFQFSPPRFEKRTLYAVLDLYAYYALSAIAHTASSYISQV